MKYRKKPIVVEAFKWTGGPDQTEDPEWVVEKIKDGTVYFSSMDGYACVLCIKTLEGTMTAIPGDYIIKGLRGELYPCKPDIFDASYESAETECPTIEPPQDERAADECDYCTGYKTIKSEEKHGIFEDICISGNTLIADINSGYMEAKINYCPMCGGKLNEK